MSALANRRSVMSFFADPLDPVGHSVRLCIAEKDINIEINLIDPDKLPEDIIELNPYNSSLTLIDRDLVLYEARIIMEYLDERFPHPPLLPVDPVSRALNRQLGYRIEKDLYNLLEDINSEDEAVANNARKVMRDHLTAIAPVFESYPFFMSEDFSLVDCFMAPILWRLEHYGVKLPPQAKPLIAYAKRLFEREGFQASLSEQERELRP